MVTPNYGYEKRQKELAKKKKKEEKLKSKAERKTTGDGSDDAHDGAEASQERAPGVADNSPIA